MNNKNYYYIAEYIDDNSNYKTSLAANTKANYISSCFRQMGKYLHIYSTAKNNKRGFVLPRIIRKSDYEVRYISSFSYKTKIGRKLLKLYTRLQLLSFFNKRTENDIVIVYHDIYLLYFLNRYKFKRKFKLIYEVEEIYSHAWNQTNEKIEYEINSIKNADGYIFVTNGLNQYVNKDNKPNVVASGSYLCIPKINDKINDGLIHCVYAGTFDTTKGGAAFAITAAKYLDEKYRIHILGFGTDKQVKNIKELIEKINKETKCCVSYEGCLTGDAYNSLLQSCHIGLSTQNPDALFNRTSFPSKIMVYFANGLNVVSVYTDEIASFKGADAIDFYHKNNPREIANAIIKSSKELKDGRKVIDNLNTTFLKKFEELLNII